MKGTSGGAVQALYNTGKLYNLVARQPILGQAQRWGFASGGVTQSPGKAAPLRLTKIPSRPVCQTRWAPSILHEYAISVRVVLYRVLVGYFMEFLRGSQNLVPHDAGIQSPRLFFDNSYTL